MKRPVIYIPFGLAMAASIGGCLEMTDDELEHRSQELFLDPTIPVIVTITELENISVGDGLDDPDFYATIVINGAKQDSAVIAGEAHIKPNRTFAQNVPATGGRAAR